MQFSKEISQTKFLKISQMDAGLYRKMEQEAQLSSEITYGKDTQLSTSTHHKNMDLSTQEMVSKMKTSALCFENFEFTNIH